MRKDDMSNINDLGGFKFSPASVDPSNGLISVQAYCIFKQIQFARNSNSDRQCKDFSPEQVSRRQEVLEFRVSGSFADSLFEKLKDEATVAVVNTHARFFPSPVIFSFFSCRAKAFQTLLLALNNPVFKSSQEGLTLATVVSYLFSSILHRPMDTFSFKAIHRLVEESRSPFSPVLFLSDLIRFDGARCAISPPFFRSVLSRHFPLRIMASIPNGRVRAQVSETSFLGTQRYTLPGGNVHRCITRFMVSNDAIAQSLYNMIGKQVDFCATTGIFLVGGFSPDSVRLFTQLLLSELVQNYSQWASRGLGMIQANFVLAGDRVFENGFLGSHLMT
ncbi:uncharacterized protein EV154DRAFT_547656 [Mucor mucedo]|uniref:uncharacterized protein n=1 Tax=Mucor mucedo TaxID=29922 RepID=UPI00222104E4|nr:uncharacterized protein EV154DRAFT_547656 [Mucor mucedo]KAI7896340.1 hypothetical protein EV154DRAFT_547656 [Mucor mucedo]